MKRIQAKPPRVLVALAALPVLACALLLAPRIAAAHAFPTAFRVLFHPTDEARIAVALRPGLALTENAGADWNFACGAASGLAGNADYATAFTAGGHLLIGAFTALYRDDGMGCGWSRLPPGGLPQGRAAGLALRASEIEALSAAPGVDNGIFASSDDGHSWRARGAALPGALPGSFLRAPSAPQRVYVTAVMHGSALPLLFVSSDGGAHWAAKPLAGAHRAQLLAVDPIHPERVFIHRSAPEEAALPDRIEVSDDAGTSFRSLFELTALGGAALSADGSVLFAGSRDGGLHRIDRDGTAELLHAGVHVGCVQLHGSTLWVCGDDLAGDPFALASSQDGGRTLVPRLRSDQLRRLRTCGQPQQAQLCSPEWNQWKNDVFGSTLDPPLIVPEAGAAAGAGGGGGLDANGGDGGEGDDASTGRAAGATPQAAPGGCHVENPRRGDPAPWLALMLFALGAGGSRSILRRRSVP